MRAALIVAVAIVSSFSQTATKEFGIEAKGFLQDVTLMKRDGCKPSTVPCHSDGVSKGGSTILTSPTKIVIGNANVDERDDMIGDLVCPDSASANLNRIKKQGICNRTLLVWKQGKRRDVILPSLIADRAQVTPELVRSAVFNEVHNGDNTDFAGGSVPDVLDRDTQGEVHAVAINLDWASNLWLKRQPRTLPDQGRVELSLDRNGLPSGYRKYSASYNSVSSNPASYVLLARLIFWAMSICLGVSGFVLLENRLKCADDPGAATDYTIIGLLLLSGVVFVIPFMFGW